MKSREIFNNFKTIYNQRNGVISIIQIDKTTKNINRIDLSKEQLTEIFKELKT